MTPEHVDQQVQRQHPPWAQAVGWLGLVLQLAAGFPYLVSGLIAPQYGVWGLWALWAGLLVLAVRLRPRKPLLTPVVAVAAVLLWVAVMFLGGALLGWRA